MSSGRIATTVVMLAIFSAMTVLAFGFPSKAAFTPLLIGIPGVVLCLAQLAIDVMGRVKPAGPGNNEDVGDRGGDAISTREWWMFFWLATFTVALVGFGFHIGGPLVVLLYVRFGERESWLNAGLAGLATLLVFWLIFSKLLELPLFDGFLLPSIF